MERQKQPEKYVKHFLPTRSFNGTPQHFGQFPSSQTITLLYYQPVFHSSHHPIIMEHYRKVVFKANGLTGDFYQHVYSK